MEGDPGELEEGFGFRFGKTVGAVDSFAIGKGVFGNMAIIVNLGRW